MILSNTLIDELEGLVPPYDKNILLDIVATLPEEFKRFFTVRLQSTSNNQEIEWIVSNIIDGIQNKTMRVS